MNIGRLDPTYLAVAFSKALLQPSDSLPDAFGNLYRDKASNIFTHIACSSVWSRVIGLISDAFMFARNSTSGPRLAARMAIAEGRLCVELGIVITAHDASVGAVRTQTPRFDIVLQIGIEHLGLDPRAQLRIIDRRDQLDPSLEVAKHPVRAADVDLFIASIRKVKDPAVLKKSPDDADDSNITRQSRHSRYQRANSANYQIDLDSRL